MPPGEMDVGLSDADRRRFWRRFWLLNGLAAAALSLLFAIALASGVFDRSDQQAPPRIRVEQAAPPPASPPPAPTLDAQGRSVTSVDWKQRPTPYYPERAQQAGVEAGSATLSCVASPEGRLGPCEIVSEDPPGMGFGDAAATSALQARVYPATVDGVPQSGRMRFTVRFRLQ
ncbi:MAG: energy transducer TonB [Brevundimonas sp.]|nr:MAG: energy transducer TonB [Brevundimonas sp.]